MPLTADAAAWADDALDRTLAAACLQATCDGIPLDAALVGHFAYLRDAYPAVYALVVIRLGETNDPMLLHTMSEGGTDD